MQGRKFITARARRVTASAALASVLALGSVLAGSASATITDGDVQLQAQPTASCVPGTDANCENATTGIVNVFGTDAFYAFSKDNGVHGQSSSSIHSGVWGENINGGYGVAGSTDSTFASATAGVWGSNAGNGPGVVATSTSGEALLAKSTDNAVDAQSSSPVHSGVWANNTGGGYGVSGSTNSATHAGVFGTNYGTGPGVLGASSTGSGVLGSATTASGIGVLASNPSGQGLKVTGGATFTGTTTFARSGTLTIPAGSSQATKSSISLSSTSLVMSTIQGNVAGVHVQGATTVTGSSGSFTVHLNQATPTALKVGYLIVN
jgi:hypothetical protein